MAGNGLDSSLRSQAFSGNVSENDPRLQRRILISVGVLDLRANRNSAITGSNLPWPSRDDLILQKTKSFTQRPQEGKTKQNFIDIMSLVAANSGVMTFPGFFPYHQPQLAQYAEHRS